MKNKKPREVCRYDVFDACWFGERCWFTHKAEKKNLTKNIEETLSTKNSILPFKPTNKRKDIFEKFIQEISFSNHLNKCCICYQKPEFYGLLLKCPHVFCFECIMKWRNGQGDRITKKDRSKCPMCKISSKFVLKKNIFLSGKKKNNAILQYKDYTRKVPCRRFVEDGKCKFGRKCFYSH